MALAALALTGCSTYYQVLRFNLPEGASTNQNEITCQNEECQLSFDFWENKGNTSFRLLNKGKQTIHIYLNELFLVKNGLASDYVQLAATHDKMEDFGSQIVSIPPGSYRNFTCPKLQSEIYEFCDVELCPTGEKVQEVRFNNFDTPLKYSLVITYSVGENSQKKSFTNSFYVDQLINYHHKDFQRFHNDTVRICNEDEIFEVQDLKSPDKFFIEY